jgi:holo-[acyl-carrier protein] synthase
MSIRGIGCDLASHARLLRVYDRHGARFLERAYHAREAQYAGGLPRHLLGGFLSSRWAAKEAVHKALGIKRLLFPDIEVVRGNGSGPPTLALHNDAALFLKGEGLELLLTLSHEEGLSLAFVVACKRMS